MIVTSVRRRAPWLLGILALYWLALFIATHLPRVPSLRVQHSDKLVHFAVFAILGFLLTALFPRLHRRWEWNVVWATIFASAYAAFDEYSQPAVGRTADVWDWVADSLGAVCGALVCLAVRWLILRLMRDKPSPVPSPTTREAQPA
jgi:VanZ family protein